MIKNYFFEEYKAKDKINPHYDNYFSDIQADIEHAKHERRETIDKIMTVIDLCNAEELEDLSELILGAADELEALRYYGR